MATTTPFYQWSVPTSSDLVKNGATAIETLGDSVDASLWNVGYGQAGKNKFINANMAIAQRGAAAQTVIPATRVFAVDRTFGALTGAGVFTVEQVVDSPAAANAGQYSMKAIVTTADTSLAASDQYFIGQLIEGLNFASFQFGTASAQTVTISFWVKSSITGTFGVDIRNSAANRSYVSTYTISAANTWEKKTVTISGDTSGTWLQDTGIGARIEWNLGAGTDYQTATPNAWTATNDQTTASQTNWMATLSNSFQITAIQVEAGSVATAFQTATGTIQAELAACQRYFQRWSLTQFVRAGFVYADSITNVVFVDKMPVVLRVTPTLTFTNMTANGNAITAASVGGYLDTNNTLYLNLTTSGVLANVVYQLYVASGQTGVISYSSEL
jgi:hypothetical protein